MGRVACRYLFKYIIIGDVGTWLTEIREGVVRNSRVRLNVLRYVACSVWLRMCMPEQP